MTRNTTSRRRFLATAGAALAAPSFIPNLRAASPNGKLRHVSFGASGMANADLHSIAGSPHVEVYAVVDVDKKNWAGISKEWPNAKLYQDWRELIEKESGNFDCANVSTPDHMHGSIGAALMRAGKHVYGQKPLTHNLKECRHLTTLAREKGVMTQMGIQVSSDFVERWAQALIKAGVIGKVKEVHSFSDKEWGDLNPVPQKSDPVPDTFNWDLWLGPAAERPFIKGYYHPGDWRKRRDFGTGTLGDMGCHMFSGWYRALDLTSPISVKSTGPAPGKDNWGINGRVEYTFPGTAYTEGKEVVVTWYDGQKSRPPTELKDLIGGSNIPGQGSIFIGTEGVLLFPHGGRPIAYQNGKRKEGVEYPKLDPRNHWMDFVDCIRDGKKKPSANFDYAGPLTEAVLLGCLASIFPNQALKWDAARLKFPDSPDANTFVGRSYRKGWEIPGLA
ncbi:MAG TPA: Gfo/Idh/MocA family oxidoreductase [Verrucomicrobiales bacterium]|jgi:predicted dehydrogenase|nr:Gfo/Idh/MocA family oxidoreductase [Verrucomicrobiales bacterium]